MGGVKNHSRSGFVPDISARPLVRLNFGEAGSSGAKEVTLAAAEGSTCRKKASGVTFALHSIAAKTRAR